MPDVTVKGLVRTVEAVRQAQQRVQDQARDAAQPVGPQPAGGPPPQPTQERPK